MYLIVLGIGVCGWAGGSQPFAFLPSGSFRDCPGFWILAAAPGPGFRLRLGASDCSPELAFCFIQKNPRVRKIVSAILGPEMAAPILWTPGKMRPLCRKNHVHKIPRFGGGGGILGFFLGGGGGECRFYFYGREDFSDSWALGHLIGSAARSSLLPPAQEQDAQQMLSQHTGGHTPIIRLSVWDQV